MKTSVHRRDESASCSFCGKEHGRGGHWHGRIGIFICETCVAEGAYAMASMLADALLDAPAIAGLSMEVQARFTLERFEASFWRALAMGALRDMEKGEEPEEASEDA